MKPIESGEDEGRSVQERAQGGADVTTRPNPEIRWVSDRIRRAAQIRRWGLAVADVVALGIGLAMAIVIGKANPGTPVWSLLLIPIWIVTAKLYGLYDNDDRRLSHHTTQELPNLLATAAVSVVVWKGLTMLLGADPPISSASVVIVGGTAAVVSIVLRSGVRTIWSLRAPPDRTLIVGSSAKAELVSSRLDRFREQGGNIEVIGFVSDRKSERDELGPAGNGSLDRHFFLGSLSDLQEVIRRERVTRVIIAKEPDSAGKVGQIIDTCLAEDVAATLVPTESEVLGPAAEVARLAEVPVIEFHSFGVPRSTRLIKRSLDLVLSGLLLIPALPILLVASLAIRSTSKGRAFFLHERVGMYGKHFKVIKLRTMYEGSEGKLDGMLDESTGEDPSFKVPDDPRVTPVGRFLRATSIDELPQLINVFKGDMSLVGPRPKIPNEASMYEERESRYLSIRPGLTGPMQVSGRGLLTFEERLALERDYLETISLAKDLEILLRTPGAVLSGRGARDL